MQSQIKFQDLNQYFSKIYVLTLKRAKERQESIAINLSGLNYTFFYGVDKQDLILDNLIKENIYNDDAAKKFSRYNKTMTLGQIGCSWSHKLIYEDVIKNQYKHVLILEDDVIPNKEGISTFTSILNDLPPNWDLLYFDYYKNTNSNWLTSLKQLVYKVQHKMGLLNLSYATINNLYPKHYTKHLMIAGYHMFTSAYAINLQTASILSQMQTPISHVADHLLSYAITNNKINGFISLPKLFTQESQGNQKLITSYVDL